MKQLMMTLLLCLSALAAAAQGPRNSEMREKLFEAKVNELAFRLNINDEQKAKFIPVYRSYCGEMFAAFGEFKRMGKPVSDKDKLDRTKRRMERQQRAQAVRIKYIDEFAKVLNADQVSRFYDEEDKIQKKLMERKFRHTGKGGKRYGPKEAK